MQKLATRSLMAACIALTQTACQEETEAGTVRIHIDVNKHAGTINRDVAGIMTDPPRPQWLQDHLVTLGLAGDREAVKRHAGGANHFWFPVLKPSFTNLGWGGDTWILFNTWPAEGEYNWEGLDAWIESHKERGTHEISLVLSAVPEWLWSTEDASEPSGAAINFFPYLKKGHVLPPSDYEKYAEMIYQTVRHLNVEKQFGIKFSVWNEPNVRFWQGIRDELLKIAAVTARAVKRADPDTMVGGPATAQFAPDWIEAFVKHFAENDLPLDFLSWHYYYFSARQRGKVMNFNQQVDAVKAILDKYPSVGKPMFYITEWAYDWKASNLIGPTFNGAYIAQSLYEMLEGGVAGASYCGGLGRLEAPDAAAQTFKFFNRLEDARLQAEISDNEPGIGLLATARDGRIAILAWSFPGEAGADSAPRPVSIHLVNLASAPYQLRRQLVDQDNYQTVEPQSVEDRTVSSDGSLKLEFTLQPYGITFIELKPVDPEAANVPAMPNLPEETERPATFPALIELYSPQSNRPVSTTLLFTKPH